MQNEPTALTAVPLGASSLDALATAITTAKRGDPLAPVTVVTPSNYSGLSTRRALGRRSGLVNVRFLVAPRLAELIAAGRTAAKARPLTPALRSEAVRAVLSDNPGPFGAVAAHPGMHRALDATFRELRDLSEPDLDRLAGASPRSAHIVTLFRAFRVATAAYFDDIDLYTAAAEVTGTVPAALRDIGHVVLYLPREQGPAELTLWRALHRQGRLAVVAAVSGDTDVDARARSLATGLGLSFPADAPPSAWDGTGVLAAADPDEEVRNVIRRIAAELDVPGGIPLHRIAVFYPSADPYAGICDELFSAASIPINGPGDRQLAGSLAGRVVLSLLEFASTGFEREAVMEFLVLPVAIGQAGSRNAQRWEYLSREAGIVGGLPQWRQRLASHASRLQRNADAVERDGRERLAERLRADAMQAGNLLECVESLARDVSFDTAATWPEYAAQALGLFDHYLPASNLPADDAEVEAHRSVRSMLENLAALAAMSDSSSLAGVINVVTQELSAPWGRAGSFDNGVFVAPLSAARGTGFDLVFVLGMVEGALPHAPREDPLLPDHERVLAPPLHDRAESRAVREREDFLAACSAAPSRVLTFPMAGIREQRKNLPSRWLLDICSHLAGRPIFTGDFEHLVEQPGGEDWMTAVPSLQSGLLSARLPAGSLFELDLRTLLAASDVRRSPHLLATPALQRGIAAADARRSAAFTEWDGNLGPAPRFSLTSGELTSPTRVESWATCGFRYFLANILHVQPTREPEAELRISPLVRGSLIHDVLETFFRERGAAKSPADGWSREDRAAIQSLGEQHCKLAEEAGVTGKPLLWRMEKAQLLYDLDVLLDLDERRRREFQSTFVDAEFAFGTPERESVALPLSAGEMRFRGRIDRVDRCADGSLLIYDYKTGSDWGFENLAQNPLANGRRLQLPVYALAARRHLRAPSARAAYWFTSYSIDGNLRELPVDDPESLMLPVLNAVAGQVAGGVFPARPGAFDRDNYGNCRFCDYNRVCPASRGQAYARKLADPMCAGYSQLVDGGPALLVDGVAPDEDAP